MLTGVSLKSAEAIFLLNGSVSWSDSDPNPNRNSWCRCWDHHQYDICAVNEPHSV